jgi:hypothetical protein
MREMPMTLPQFDAVDLLAEEFCLGPCDLPHCKTAKKLCRQRAAEVITDLAAADFVIVSPGRRHAYMNWAKVVLLVLASFTAGFVSGHWALSRNESKVATDLADQWQARASMLEDVTLRPAAVASSPQD